MLLWLNGAAALCIFLQLGTTTGIFSVSAEHITAPEHPDLETKLLLQTSSYHLHGVPVEARGIFQRIRNKFKGFVDGTKKLLVGLILKFMFKKKLPESCHEDLGCFFYNESMSLEIGGPESPEKLDTTFYFFKNGSKDLEALLRDNETQVMPEKTFTLSNWTSDKLNDCLDLSKPLMVVTHGLTGNKRTQWMLPLVRALLQNVACTVLVVDWAKGANGSYPDAGINTPMAGALISRFLQKVLNATSGQLGPKNITLIGFSMGAQVMGFAGRHYTKTTGRQFWRISGLDPAGWLYEDTNSTLSKKDAEYVDVIHTNGGSIRDFRIGLYQSVGHVDFYPNGGSVQTGCKSAPKFPYKDYLEVITCSHYKATYMFIESLNNKNCTFVSYGCENWNDFAKGNCTKRVETNQTGALGFYSYLYAGRNNQYLYTNAEPPFCRGTNTTRPN